MKPASRARRRVQQVLFFLVFQTDSVDVVEGRVVRVERVEHPRRVDAIPDAVASPRIAVEPERKRQTVNIISLNSVTKV